MDVRYADARVPSPFADDSPLNRGTHEHLLWCKQPPAFCPIFVATIIRNKLFE